MPNFWGMHTQGATTPKFELGRDFCTIRLTPSFIVLCLLIQKLSCWQTNKQMLQQEAYPAIWPLLTSKIPKLGHPWGYPSQNRRRPVWDVAEPPCKISCRFIKPGLRNPLPYIKSEKLKNHSKLCIPPYTTYGGIMNKHTNRRRWKHATLFATLRRRVIKYIIHLPVPTWGRKPERMSTDPVLASCWACINCCIWSWWLQHSSNHYYNHPSAHWILY